MEVVPLDGLSQFLPDGAQEVQEATEVDLREVMEAEAPEDTEVAVGHQVDFDFNLAEFCYLRLLKT